MSNTICYIPGIMLSQTVPTVRGTVGASVATLLSALNSYSYRAVHSLDITDPEERREFGAIIRERELWLDFCVSRALGNQKTSLAAAGTTERQRAVDLVMELIPCGVEQGARYLSLSSGSGHIDGNDRAAAIDRFAESLASISGMLSSDASGVGLLIEPMDVDVHKRGSLGYVDESVALVRSLQSAFDDVKLVCDTAHLRLNNESASDLISTAPELIAAIHLCNCCIDSSDEFFGDHHIKPGIPGEFDLDDYRGQLEEAATIIAVGEPCMPVFLEYRNHGDVDEHLRYLLECWHYLID